MTGLTSEQVNTEIERAVPPCSFCNEPSVLTTGIAGPGAGTLQEIHCCGGHACCEQERELLERLQDDTESSCAVEGLPDIAGAHGYRALPVRALVTFGDLVNDARGAIAQIEVAAEEFGIAVKHEMLLEDGRQALRPVVVDRIATTYAKSATAAEKLLEADPEYMTHRRRQYDAVIEKERHRGEYDAAKLRARLAVALVEAHAEVRA